MSSPMVRAPSNAAIQRASSTAAAAAAASRLSQSSGMMNDTTVTPRSSLQRTSMLVQLQQPTASGGSVVQPVSDLTSSSSYKTLSPFPSLKAHGAALISVSLALSQTPVFTLRDHGYEASVSRGVPVYIPAVKPVPNYTAW